MTTIKLNDGKQIPAIGWGYVPHLTLGQDELMLEMELEVLSDQARKPLT
jgi:hypothetical protein